MTSSTSATGQYILTRNRTESDRLETQYRAWQANIGYLLHPDIPQHDHISIADVGTGTGIWLRDLAEVLPGTCQLDGFDISDIQFPDTEGLPRNINFYLQNLLQPFPAKFLGKYDVVNIRVMVVALSFHEWEPAVRNMMTLLKPGGYLQWVDCAAHQCVVKGATPEAAPIHAEKFLDLLRMTVTAFGKTANSVTELHSLFQKCGLVACEERVYPLINIDTRNDVNTAVLDGIEHIVTAALRIGKIDGIQTTEQILAQKQAAMKDLKNLNCWYCYDVHVVVGRKE